MGGLGAGFEGNETALIAYDEVHGLQAWVGRELGSSRLNVLTPLWEVLFSWLAVYPVQVIVSPKRR